MTFDHRSKFFAPIFLFTLALLIGCGGGRPPVSQSPSIKNVVVTVTPDLSTVDQGATVQFSAQVRNNADQRVTWSILEGPAGGSITPSGLFTAPAKEGPVHIVATSVADPGKSGTAVVTTNAVSVSMLSKVAVPRGRQRQFSASVRGTVNKDVIWMIDEGGAGGAISSGGLYTAPMNGGPYHVTARSLADNSRSATSEVTLSDAGFRLLATSTLAPRINHTATLLPDGKVLIVGGRLCSTDICSNTLLASAELFDPATETFSPTGPMAVPREGHTATLLPDGTVLVAGGVAADHSEVIAEIYDPAAGGFTRVGELSQRRGWHTASLLADGRVLIAGGGVLDTAFGFAPLKSAELYDPATHSFSPAGNMPKAAMLHTANTLPDGTVLISGGTSDGCDSQVAVARFDPVSSTFSAGADLGSARMQHTATTLQDGNVLITGGDLVSSCFDTSTLRTAVLFDPATSVFSPDKAMLNMHAGHSATLLADGNALVADSTAELFLAATSTFVVTGTPNPSRGRDSVWPDTGRQATRLADGRVLFTGYAAPAEIYE